MEKPDVLEAGKIIKPFGYKGALMVNITPSFQELIYEKGFVFIELDEELVPFLITSMEEEGGNAFQICFEDIEDSDAAKALNGLSVWIPKESLPEGFLMKNPLVDVSGFSVVDKHHGEVGVAKEVMELPGHEVLAIQLGKKEILLPLGGNYVKKVDRKKRTIHIEAPPGLIESYL